MRLWNVKIEGFEERRLVTGDVAYSERHGPGVSDETRK